MVLQDAKSKTVRIDQAKGRFYGQTWTWRRFHLPTQRRPLGRKYFSGRWQAENLLWQDSQGGAGTAQDGAAPAAAGDAGERAAADHKAVPHAMAGRSQAQHPCPLLRAL